MTPCDSKQVHSCQNHVAWSCRDARASDLTVTTVGCQVKDVPQLLLLLYNGGQSG